MVEKYNITDVFLNNLLNIRQESLTENIIAVTKNHLLDYYGCVIAGSTVIRDRLQMYVDSINEPAEDAYVFGIKKKATAQTAALLNGISAHCLELDDGHRGGAIHVGATIFSALLAIAEKEKLGGIDFLYGSIIGYETAVRLACVVQPGNKQRGYHATGTCGTIGAAMGIAAALHFSKEQMNTTLAAAVTSSAGILEVQEDGSELKPYNVGRAAMDAVAAAYIGKSGCKGPKDVLGGKRGFIKVMTDSPHVDYLTNFNDNTFCIQQTYQKIYAACRHAHPAIEAALVLREKVKVEEILIIEVRAYKHAVAGHDHTVIQGVSSAKMSIPFSVAVSLVTGNAGILAYTDETVSDPRILSLAKIVSVMEDEVLTAQSPAKRASILTIRTIHGDYSYTVEYSKGEPENPLTEEELYTKFHSLAFLGGFSKEKCDDFIKQIKQENFTPSRLSNYVNL